jgi:hypothetical protein
MVNNPIVFSAFIAFAEETSNQFLVKFIHRIHKEYITLSTSPKPYISGSIKHMFSLKPTIYKLSTYLQKDVLYTILGQLVKKDEAAGKVRVFAMVDG